MAQAAENPELFSFANNFWGPDDHGVTVLLDHVNNVKLTSDELRNFYRERTAIEDEYARKLLALSRKALGTHEIGSLKQALNTVRIITETSGKSHAAAAAQFRAELDDPLAAFAANIRARRKTTQALADKLTKAKQAQNAAAERTRERFEAECNRINGYFAQQNLLMGKELERNNQKLDKAHVSVEMAKRDYQNSLRLLAEATDRWAKDWKDSCDKFQDSEEERVSFLKSSLWAYTNIVSTVCVSDDEGCESIRVALEGTDVMADNELFVRTKATGSEILDPPEFINYLNGYSPDSATRSYKTAHFPRISQANYGQEFFGPDASVASESAVNASNPASAPRNPQFDQSVNSVNSATDAQTVLIGGSQRGSVYGRQSTLTAQPQQQPRKQNSFTLQDIPNLGPPTEDYGDSLRGSPVQMIMSRQGSMNSNPTSISDNEDHELNGRQAADKSASSDNNNGYSRQPYVEDVADQDSLPPPRMVLPSDSRPGSSHTRYSNASDMVAIKKEDADYEGAHSHDHDNGNELESTPTRIHYPESHDSRNAPAAAHNQDRESAHSFGYGGAAAPAVQAEEEAPAPVHAHTPTRVPIAPAATTPEPVRQPESEEPKRRTWASPFRRRSKKDLKKGWGSNGGAAAAASDPVSPVRNSYAAPTAALNSNAPPSSPLSERRPVSRYQERNSYTGSNINRNNSGNSAANGSDASRPSTVLSMGDNMFDLGVNPTRNIADQRAKSMSPVKSFSRDDPMVMALEKLKVTGGGSAPRSTSGGSSNNDAQSVGQSIGSNNGGALRHQNSGAALVPPGPAFTSNEMQAASNRYSNQTREMFDVENARMGGRDGHGGPDPRVHRGSSNGGYSRGNGDNGSAPPPTDRRAVSPRPSNSSMGSNNYRPQGIHAMQRPHTMYEQDFHQAAAAANSALAHAGGEYDGHYQSRTNSYQHHQRSQSSVPTKRYDDGYSEGYNSHGSNNGRAPSPNPMAMQQNRAPSPNPMMMQQNRAPSPNPMMMQQNRAPSPNPMMQNRAPSPNPMMMQQNRSHSPNPMMMQQNRSHSPNPMMMQQNRSHSPNPMMMQQNRSHSPNPMMMQQQNRAPSPNPMRNGQKPRALSPSLSQIPLFGGDDLHSRYPTMGGGSNKPGNNNNGRNSAAAGGMPANRAPSPNPYGEPLSQAGIRGGFSNGGQQQQQQQEQFKPRSKSAVEMRSDMGMVPRGQQQQQQRGRPLGGGPSGQWPTVSQDGRPAMFYARAKYEYRTTMEEEVSFRSGDVLLIVKTLEDGWWEAEVLGGSMGLAPSNFLTKDL